jgi:hypothetical protein
LLAIKQLNAVTQQHFTGSFRVSAMEAPVAPAPVAGFVAA